MSDWYDTNPPDTMADPLTNIEWAIREMVNAMADGRYRYERVHVEADLRYLLGETRRARAALARSAPATHPDPTFPNPTQEPNP